VLKHWKDVVEKAAGSMDCWIRRLDLMLEGVLRAKTMQVFSAFFFENLHRNWHEKIRKGTCWRTECLAVPSKYLFLNAWFLVFTAFLKDYSVLRRNALFIGDYLPMFLAALLTPSSVWFSSSWNALKIGIARFSETSVTDKQSTQRRTPEHLYVLFLVKLVRFVNLCSTYKGQITQ
jgi:hypothetical protein